MHCILFMGFYFCGKYINTDCEDKYVERAMFGSISFFGVLMIIMDMKLGKTILKISLVISP